MISYDYDRYFEQKLRLIARHCHSILDVGGGRPFQKRLKDARHLMAGKEYRTLDINPATKPDIIGDAHAIPLPDASVDAVLHLYVMEHLFAPHRAAAEMRRVLKPGGYLLGMVPFVHPYHAKKGAYRDYWRFCPDALEEMFEGFSHLELFKIGRYFRAWIGFLPFLWRFRAVLEPVAYALDRLVDQRRNTTAGFIIFARK